MEIRTPSQLILISAFIGMIAGGLILYGMTGKIQAGIVGAGIGALIGEWPLVFIAKPPAQPGTRVYDSTFRAALISEDGRQGTFATFPVSEDQMVKLARGLVLERREFTFDLWTAGRGKVFERHEFSAVRDEMVRRGLAEWRSPGTTQRGVVLTNAGRAWLYFLATGKSPHSLAGEDVSESV